MEKSKDHLILTSRTLQNIDQEPINKLIEHLAFAKHNNHTVYTFGNGGSHSNASHFANDLFKARGIKAICLSDATPTMLAYMNDDGANVMYARMLNRMWEDGDLIIAFSCSGNSKNITSALFGGGSWGKALFTGDDGGEAQNYAETVIKIPHPNIRIQESCHSAICHAIIEELIDD